MSRRQSGTGPSIRSALGSWLVEASSSTIDSSHMIHSVQRLSAEFHWRLVTLFALLCVATTGACQTGRGGRAPDAATAARWSNDSAKYVRDSIKWVHDSLVIDSISRSIKTDSLYRLYRAQLRAGNPIPLERAINCERAKLHWVYGSLAAVDAIDRMFDTLFRASDSADRTRVSNRLGNMSADDMMEVSVTQRTCGRTSLWGPLHPDSVSGTPLLTRAGRPARPKPIR